MMLVPSRLTCAVCLFLGNTLSVVSSFSRVVPVQRRTFSLRMALTPVGPFCPFRSSAALEIEPKMEQINSAGPEFATEMARLQLDMQMGQNPEPERLMKVADGIESAVDQWENLVTRLRLSNDFQTREYAKLTQAHLDNHGVTVDSIAAMMRWQSGCLRAIANNTPPPMPPPGMDLQKMMEQGQSESAPSMTAMAAAEKITSTPFTGKETLFESETVKEEYEKLCRDHSQLIEFGSSYDTFDPLGKICYLDEIEKIEERWDIFFTRFSLMGALDKGYTRQCNDFLASMGMNQDDFKKLLKKCHQIMRDDAEKERDGVPYSS